MIDSLTTPIAEAPKAQAMDISLPGPDLATGPAIARTQVNGTANPLVSVLINNFNYGQFLPEAIDSVLSQTYPNIEIIVVDDGSTDESPRILQTYGQRYGDRIIPILKTNGGQASAFNAGFAASRGDILCFLDADDLFCPDKVAQVVQVFQQNPEADWCFHPLKLLESASQQLLENSYRTKGGLYDLTDAVHQGKLAGETPFHSMATSGMCFRRSLLATLLPMPESIRITSDDYLKYLAFGLRPGFFDLHELSIQRIHGNNAYTLRPEKLLLQAKIHLLTAYWMRFHYPSLTRFCNSLAAAGFSLAWRAPQTDADCQTLQRHYLSFTPPLPRLKLYARAFYYWFKDTLKP
jgi:glycosyltransferase involved in cell wall biosynthesis